VIAILAHHPADSTYDKFLYGFKGTPSARRGVRPLATRVQ
jgi:hypothetical protein